MTFQFRKYPAYRLSSSHGGLIDVSDQDFDDEELRNMFRRTPQPGLWFIAGSLAQCRIYSKPLALQIKASEERLLEPEGGEATSRPALLTEPAGA